MLDDMVIGLIFIIMFVLLLPIIFLIFATIIDKVVCPFYEWYLDGLDKLWIKIKGVWE